MAGETVESVIATSVLSPGPAAETTKLPAESVVAEESASELPSPMLLTLAPESAAPESECTNPEIDGVGVGAGVAVGNAVGVEVGALVGCAVGVTVAVGAVDGVTSAVGLAVTGGRGPLETVEPTPPPQAQSPITSAAAVKRTNPCEVRLRSMSIKS